MIISKIQKILTFFDGPQSDYPFAGEDENDKENQAGIPSEYDYIPLNGVLYVSTLLNR